MRMVCRIGFVVVMIPNFNYGRYIGDTIQSVLAQAPSNVEIWALRALAAAGSLGTTVAKSLRERIEARWKARESRPGGR